MDNSATTPVTISAFEWVPDFARGQVRDLIVRWALEEIGRAYQTQLINAGAPRSAEYLGWQPFDQVPAYRDEHGEMFESGAILLHLGEQDERILPRDPAQLMEVQSWLLAAHGSIEAVLRPITLTQLFNGDKEWCKPAVAAMMPTAEKRLQQLANALGSKPWIAGTFSIADIVLVYVLRSFGGEMINDHANLLAYRERGVARPAFQRALQAQLNDLTGTPNAG